MTSSIAQEAVEKLKMSLSGVESGKTVEIDELSNIYEKSMKIDENISSRQYPGSYREVSTRSIDW